MNSVTIPNTNFTCSKFIFGTSGHLSILNKQKRQYLFNMAVDNNFSHFDTSPYYGFGLVEKELKDILKNKDLTVTSKVCLYPSGGSDQKFSEMFFRKSFGKLYRPLSKPIINFTIDEATKSLEGSLRRLGRDCIDILLIHEPIIEHLNCEEWQKWFYDIIKSGKIKYTGISSLNIHRLEKFILKNNITINIIQSPDSIESFEADFLKKYNLPMQITFGYMSSYKKKNTLNSFNEIFSQIAERNPHGPIIVSARSVKHLSEISNLINK